MLCSDVIETVCYEGYCRVSSDVGYIVVWDGEELMVVMFEQSVDFET